MITLEIWGPELLEASKRRTEVEFNRFLELVDMAENNCTLEVSKLLMKTFLAEPDYGSQERVISVLASAPNEIYITALLEELPRLVQEAPEWARVMVGTEINFLPNLLLKEISQSPKIVKDAFETLLSHPDYHPEFRAIYESVQNMGK